jgi:hypothetical protein
VELEFTHITEGKVTKARMEQRPRTARMTIYFLVDTSIQRVFVILGNPHNHPAYAKAKAMTQDKKPISSTVEAADVVGLTACKLN